MDYSKYMGGGTSGGPQGGSKNGGADSENKDDASITLVSKDSKQTKDDISGSPGGDYQQYMDYQKYMPQGGGKGGGKGGDYQQYMDYQKYMKQGGGKNDSGAKLNLVASDMPASSAAKLPDASASASAPMIALVASSDIADAQSVPPTPVTSSASAHAPLFASTAGKIELVSET